MNGAERILQLAAAAGLEVCFANPGTTEMPLVAALDATPGVRAVLCLFEGVCTGAADGYGRMAGRPALTLLHLGPGLANGIANLHNARRARSPIVNLVGDHASWHLAADAPLASDIHSLARPVSAWVRRSASAPDLGPDMAEAIAVACGLPGQIATLIVPHDYQLSPVSREVALKTPRPPDKVDDRTIAQAVTLLRGRQPSALMLGGAALGERGLRAAARVAAATGCALLCETFSPRLERGAGLPALERFPYFPEQALRALEPYGALLLAGAREPVAFFGYPGLPSRLVHPAQSLEVLASPEQDVPGALEALADALLAPGTGPAAEAARPERPSGPLSTQSLAAALAAVQPEGAIIVDEGNLSSAYYFRASAGAPRHSYLNLTGGAIGFALPCAIGAALACPDRPVIVLEADGSAMYTLQALWTQARQKLNVTTLLCNNRGYQILGVEMRRAGVAEIGPQARALIDFADPAPDWVKLAEGLGVAAARVDTAECLTRELERALAEPGPHLLEAVLSRE